MSLIICPAASSLIKNHVAAMCTMMGCSATPAAISKKADFSNFIYSMFGETFFPFPRNLLGSQRFSAYCICWHIPHDGARIPWIGLQSCVGWDALVLSCPLVTLADYFWARLCWEETLEHYTVQCKHINAMLRARFETQKIQDVP